MAQPRSYTFSSKGFLGALLATLGFLAGVEIYLSLALEPFERQLAATSADFEELPQTPGYHKLGTEEPVDFLISCSGAITGHPVVFIGDSQGANVRGGGRPYPEQVAEILASSDDFLPVVSLHLQGTNVYEQSILLLCVLKAGIEPCCVVWAGSVYSLRENEVRSELSSAFLFARDGAEELMLAVVPPVDPGELVTDENHRNWFQTAVGAAQSTAFELATFRFMQRSLLEKAEILRRSPLGRLLGIKSFGTGHQSNPSASILTDAASVVARVSSMLEARGIETIVFLAPYDQEAEERTFSPQAEELVRTELESELASTDARFVDLSAALSGERYGAYSDGVEDPLHFDHTGHRELAEQLVQLIRPYLPR